MKKNKYIPNLATLCYLTQKDQILLGRKKYGKAAGILNGFGGKVEYRDKSVKDSVFREFKEETSIELEKVTLNSILEIQSIDRKGHVNNSICIYIYIAQKWSGTPVESKEMKVEWHDRLSVPLDEMWEGDRNWFYTATGKRKCYIRQYFESESNQPTRLEVEFVNRIDEDYYKKNQ